MESPVQETVNQNNFYSPTKRHRARRKKIVKENWNDYTQNTTLHGLKYTTEPGLHIIEKIFWMLTCLISCGLCLLLIRNVWHKWQTSPVIVSFSEKIVPVEMVPFPSLTICPQTKSKLSDYNYTKYLTTFFYESGEIHKSNPNITHSDNTTKSSLNDEEMKTFLDVSLMCPLPFFMKKFDIKSLRGPDITDVSTVNKILEVSPNIKYIIRCFVLGHEKNCSHMFFKVLTDEGVCYNFNGMAANEILRMENIQQEYSYSDTNNKSSGWNADNGYDNSDDVNYTTQYPARSQYNRHSPYLEIYLRTPKRDNDENCNVVNRGYKMYIQHPASYPQSSVYAYSLMPEELTAMALEVNMIETSEKLKHYDAKVRQCYFSYERYLRYFKTYTSTNCLFECMTNYTFQMCQCVPFHMPHSDSRSICTLRKEDCVKNCRVSTKNLRDAIEKCDCLPNCNSITYSADILKSEFNLQKSVQGFLKINKEEHASEYYSRYEFSKLEVYYKDSSFVTITRSELFGVTDFLANIGGLLGLFVGFSFLSVVEFVYFFTIRLGYKFRKDAKNEITPMDMKTLHTSQPANVDAGDGSMNTKHM